MRIRMRGISSRIRRSVGAGWKPTAALAPKRGPGSAQPQDSRGTGRWDQRSSGEPELLEPLREHSYLEDRRSLNCETTQRDLSPVEESGCRAQSFRPTVQNREE